jgi:co-chaperonin GroES (HSP10)
MALPLARLKPALRSCEPSMKYWTRPLMQENENPHRDGEAIKRGVYHENERLNRPHWKRFRLQGEDRFLVRIHQEVEQTYGQGKLIVPVSNQTVPSTGEIIALSPMSEEGRRKHPDVRIGAHIQVIPCTWTTVEIFDSTGNIELMATGTLDYIVAVYHWTGESLEELAARQELDQIKALDDLKVQATTSTGTAASGPSGPLIRIA